MVILERAPYRAFAHRLPKACLRLSGHARRALRLFRSAFWDEPRPAGESLLPQPKSAAKGIVVLSSASVRRQRLQLMDVAASEHCVFGFKRRDEAVYDVGNFAPPFLLAAGVLCRFSPIFTLLATP